MLLYAQIVAPVVGADPLGGWGSLLLQGGSFMLLCVVLLWLVPKELREQREERQRRDERFENIVRKLEDGFESRTVQLMQGLKQQTETLCESMESSAKMTADKVAIALREENLRRFPT